MTLARWAWAAWAALALAVPATAAQGGPAAPGPAAANTAKAAAPPAERWAALTRPMFQAVGAQQGLGNVVVMAVAQDRQGFLWAGTAGGLSRWDGYRFRNYVNVPGDPRSLPDNDVLSLHIDRRGRLWAGTASGGLARYVPEDDGFVTYDGKGVDLAAGGVMKIADAAGAGLWLATTTGLVHFDGGDDPARARLTRYRHDPADPASVPADLVDSLAVGADGTLWVGTRNGLARRDPGGAGFVKVPVPVRSADGPAVAVLFLDRDGLLWIGTGGDGVFVHDPRSGRMGRHADGAAAAALMKNVNVTGIAEPVPGEVWVSSYADGVAVIDRASGRARHLPYAARAPGGLSSTVVRALFADRAGALWVGTDNGLNQLPPGQTALSLGPRQGALPGLAEDDVMSLAEAADGRVWVGLVREGADVIDPARARVTPWQPMRARLNGKVPSANVTVLWPGPDGKVWLATPSGLFRAAPDGTATTPVAAPWLDNRLNVHAMAGVGGSLWLGTSSAGLFQARPDGGALRKIGLVGGLAALQVTDLAAGPAGSLWVATVNGLNRIDAAGGAVLERVGADRADPASLSHPHVSALLVDRRGRLWVGNGGGIDVMERGADGQRRFHRLGAAQGMPNTNVCMLLEDALGRVWASTDDGLAVIDPDSYAIGVLGRADGVLYSPYWERSGVATRAGELLFGGSGGVTVVRPERYRPWRLAPPLAVTEVLLGGKPVPPGRYQGGAAPLVVRAEANSFAVGFAALDFTAPELNRYAYRLDGFDRDWISADAEHRLASYTNLPPGRYRLLIRGSNRRGLWSETDLALAVEVLPWWWQSWWFRGAAALLAAVALWGAYRLRTWQLAAQRHALEREVAARTAEVLRQKALADQQRGEAERQHREASERNAELAAVNAVAQILAGKLELDQLIALVGDQVRRLFQAERTSITLLDEPGGALLLAYAHAHAHADAMAAAHDAALGRVVATGQGELVEHAPAEGEGADGGPASWLCVPIIANGVARGAVSVRRPAAGAPGPYQASDQRLLDTIAAHLGAALQSAQLFQQAEAARARAEEATQAKSMFLANMSHEIRTPMNAVIGLSYLALGTSSPARQRDYLQKIHNAGNSLVAIISDILDFSKIEAGKLDLETADFDLDELLAHVAAIGGAAHGAGLECNFDVPAAVPRGLRGDAQRLGQVLINLLNNALKFTAAGEVALAVRALDERDGRVRLQFSVRDSGIGMSAPQLAKLFQAFTQADGSATRRFGGTGLGLSICKNLVELMGGTIGADSAPGVGSRFVVELWLERAAAASAVPLPPALQGLRVLVVDDNATARAALLGALASLGLDAAAVDGPHEAAARLLAGAPRYDLVLVDADPCGAAGAPSAAAVLAGAVARHGAAPALALLTCVAGDEPGAVPRVGGADAWLVKPVTRTALADTLLRLFAPERRQGQEQGGGGQRPRLPRFDGARVLLVEDNEINQEIAIALLEACGILVELAGNGREALERLRAADAAGPGPGPGPGHFQLVFMDLHMPELDGHAATVRLRQDARFDALPIIAMTANAMPAERQRCRDEGFDDHLSKPLIPAELHCMLGQYLAAAGGGRDERAGPGRRARPAALADGVAGLDLAVARQGVNGDEALLLKVLRMFRRDERDRAGRIRAALGRRDHAAAERHAHSLRGLADGIGAAPLARLAGDVERAARGRAAPEAVAPALAALEDALARLCDGLDLYLPAEAAAAAGAARPAAAWLDELRRLAALMRACDGAAITAFGACAADFAASFGSWDAEAVQRGLDDLDFDGAHTALRWVAHQHGLEL